MKMPVDKRPKFRVRLIEDPGNLKVPTWDEMGKVVKNSLKSDADFKKLFIKKYKLDATKVDLYIDQLKKATVGKKITNAELKNFQIILEYNYGCNPLFSGKGFTVTPDGKFGLREWILNKPGVGWDISDMQKAGFKVKEIILNWE